MKKRNNRISLTLVLFFILTGQFITVPVFAGEIINNGRWGIRSNKNQAQIKYAFDASPQSAWDSITAQQAGDYITIDFGKEVLITGVLLTADSREKPRKYPRSVNVLISADGKQWKSNARKELIRKDRPLEIIPFISISLEPSLTRFLKISLTGSAGVSWSIADCRILGKEDIKNICKNRSVIVTEAEASPTVLFAAEELKKHLGQMGYMVKIEKDRNIDTKTYSDYIFRLGKAYLKKHVDKNTANLGSDGYMIKNSGKDVWISGNTEISILYGVYTLLERLGVRWFYPGLEGEYIPDNFSVNNLRGINLLETPSYLVRGFRPPSITDPQKILWCVRNKINAMGAVGALAGPNILFYASNIEKIGGKEYYYSNAGWMWPRGHSYAYFLNTKEYFKEHSEYFPLIDGKRTGGNKQQLCTSNPEVIKIFKKKILDYLATDPPVKLIAVSPNDGAVKWCQCKNCQKLDGPNPKKILWCKKWGREVSDRNLIFVRKIAQEVRKKYPKAKIVAWAYSVFNKPPLYIKKMPDNVILEICQYGDPAQIIGTVKENEETLKKMRDWAKIKGLTICVYDYFLSRQLFRFPDLKTPLFFTNALFHKLRLYNDKLKVKYYRTEYCWSVQRDNPLLWYAYVKILWNAHINEQKFYDDFFEKYYGKASKPMKRYFMMMMKRIKKKKIIYGNNYNCPPPKGLYDAEITPVIDKLFERANTLAGDKRIIRQRIQRDFNAYQYAKQYLNLK